MELINSRWIDTAYANQRVQPWAWTNLSLLAWIAILFTHTHACECACFTLFNGSSQWGCNYGTQFSSSSSQTVAPSEKAVSASKCGWWRFVCRRADKQACVCVGVPVLLKTHTHAFAAWDTRLLWGLLVMMQARWQSGREALSCAWIMGELFDPDHD